MKKKSLLSVLLVLQLSAILPLTTFAWGADGHRYIVQTALSILSPQAKQKVLAALGNGYTPDLAAVWMDSVREKNVAQYRYMKNWHFVNMEPGQTYTQVAKKNDVVYNLQRMIDFFKQIPPGVSKDSIRTNLKILMHLMGDITQPLHVGYGHDTGGNDDVVTTPIYNSNGGKPNNLHHVWDVVELKEGKINLASCLAYYHHLNASQIDAINQGNAVAWLAQARSYLPQVYACNPVQGQNTNISLAYLDSNVAIVQQQLDYAAIRLANVLEKAFHA